MEKPEDQGCSKIDGSQTFINERKIDEQSEASINHWHDSCLLHDINDKPDFQKQTQALSQYQFHTL